MGMVWMVETSSGTGLGDFEKMRTSRKCSLAVGFFEKIIINFFLFVSQNSSNFSNNKYLLLGAIEVIASN
mgnify:CR=1 FL=1